jgi:competence protein CoiA
MPFVAKHRDTGERVDITQIQSPRIELKKDEYICQLCEQPMIIKAGMIVSPHFAHKVQCSSNYESQPESAEHRLGKMYISDHLKQRFTNAYMEADIQYEVPIPEIKRVADILAVFPMGWRIAHEIQLSSITIEILQARTIDYANAGIDVIWWLGKAADTPANRNWCVENFGVCYQISFGEYQDKL